MTLNDQYAEALNIVRDELSDFNIILSKYNEFNFVIKNNMINVVHLLHKKIRHPSGHYILFSIDGIYYIMGFDKEVFFIESRVQDCNDLTKFYSINYSIGTGYFYLEDKITPMMFFKKLIYRDMKVN